MIRPYSIVFALVSVLAIAGCAQVPTDPDERAEFEEMNDPLEPANRSVFDFNMALDRAIMKPVASFYSENVGDGIRRGVHNTLNNLRSPYIFSNDILQGHPRMAADTLGRFMINSTFGLLGIFDVAGADGGPKYHDNDLGTTLAVWGLPEGPYVMLPFFGPSNPREIAARTADWFSPDPTGIALHAVSSGLGPTRTATDMVDSRTQMLEPMDDIERNSIDLYAAVRSLYRQQRASQAARKQISESESL
jgi:phospholipid-binding lipoprotein MlaA